MTFISYILKAMEEKGITAYKLCKDTGLSQQTFSNWKAGKMPALDKAITVVIYLGLSMDEIFGIKKNNINLTLEEKQLLKAYRSASSGMQEAARKLLDVPELEIRSSIYSDGKEAI